MSLVENVLDEVDLSSFCIIDAAETQTKTQIFFPSSVGRLEHMPENNVEKILQQEFINICTSRSSLGTWKNEHVIMNSLEDTKNETSIRSGDLLMELNDEPAHRFSHKQIVQHLRNVLHQNGLTIEIKLKIKRREHGLPVLITCIIRLEFEETGTWHVRIEYLSIAYAYKSKSKNTCRFETSTGKYFKITDKSLDIASIDDPSDIKYNFEYILYEVGPNESFKYDYMFCLRALIEDDYYYLCPDESDGICLERRREIKDDNWEVQYDNRFYFQKDRGDICYIEKELHSGIYLSCNESDDLEFKVAVCVPWSKEAQKEGTSKEYQFQIYNVNKC